MIIAKFEKGHIKKWREIKLINAANNVVVDAISVKWPRFDSIDSVVPFYLKKHLLIVHGAILRHRKFRGSIESDSYFRSSGSFPFVLIRIERITLSDRQRGWIL